MEKLKEVLIRYSIITGIPLKVEDDKLELREFFNEAMNRGLLSKENFDKINSLCISF